MLLLGMRSAVRATRARRRTARFLAASFHEGGDDCHPFQSIHALLSRKQVPSDDLFQRAVNDQTRPPTEVVPPSSSWDNAILSLYTSCQRVDPTFGRALSDATYHRLVLRSRRACRQQKSPARALMWHQERSKHRTPDRLLATPSSVKMFNTMIDICAKTNALSMAERLYSEMMKTAAAGGGSGGTAATLYSVTALIEAQSRGGRPLEAIRGSLSAYYSYDDDDDDDDLDLLRDPILSTFAENGGAPAAVLLDSLGFCGAPVELLETAFEAIPPGARNRNHYLSMVEAHARCGRVDAALDVIRRMGACGLSRRGHRKASVYATVLSLLPRTGNNDRVEQKVRAVARALGDAWWFRKKKSAY
jgi:pentatricopeptide repeat protein